MFEAFEYEFMRNALAAGILASVACGVIGSFVVLNRIVFLSAGIAHAAYGGIGLGFFFGFNPVIGAVGFSLAAALGMGVAQRRTGQRADTLIGVMWAIGMALGVILVDRTAGYKTDLMSYLFGSILTVPSGDLVIMLVLDVVIIIGTGLLYKELLAISFDENHAVVQRVPVTAIYLVFVCMIALTVVMLMRVVGLILLIALLTMPAAISALFVRDMRRMMVVAGLVGAAFTSAGLWLSYTFNIASGATIILLTAAVFLVCLVVRRGLNA
jgi:zinc transport system permease protein